jgi:hypothetical protein
MFANVFFAGCILPLIALDGGCTAVDPQGSCDDIDVPLVSANFIPWLRA